MRYTGIVQRGTARAKALGYSTINIPLDDASVSGVYAAKVKVGEEAYEAAAFADQKRNVLEAHILDFPAQGGSASGGTADLYGWSVTIELLKKIRESKKFADDRSLRKAIEEDVARVREYFTQ